MSDPQLDATLAADRDALEALQATFDARLRGEGREAYGRLHAAFREASIRLVWNQVDRVGPMSEVETARFILRRLYPDLDGPRLESAMARLNHEFAAGTWSGFERRPRD